MFQIAWNKEKLDVEVVGLDKIDGLRFPSNTHMYYVMVTPVGTELVIIVPKGCFVNVSMFYCSISEDMLFPHM
jgi:hypothetical protein